MSPKTLSVHDLQVHAWWSDTIIYSDYFFDMTASLQFDTFNNDAAVLFQELTMIRHSFAEADYPECVSLARSHLLNSMNQVMAGLKAFIAGNVEAAHSSMNTAQNELFYLEDELNRIGVSVLFLQRHIQ